MNEFELISRYFARRETSGTLLGIGDDAAVLSLTRGRQLVAAIDTLVEGTHFLAGTPPDALGHKALAVNLSDLAAMGATPRWSLLALTLPAPIEAWLRDFAQGFFRLADAHGVALVGGDTTRGPLSISVQVLGEVLPGGFLTRGGAQTDDAVYVTGTLGDAAIGLRSLRADAGEPGPELLAMRRRLTHPTPRVEFGQALVGVATAAIDLSDGLAGDLGHILAASRVGAILDLAALPLSDPVRAAVVAGGWDPVLRGGDDYELCFTAPAASNEEIGSLAAKADVRVTRIGIITAQRDLRARREDGVLESLIPRGFDHFP